MITDFANESFDVKLNTPLEASQATMSNCISDKELNELTSKVEFMLTQLTNVESFINKLHVMVDKGTFKNTKHGMSLLDVKFHLLIMYCSKLCVYISMRSKGESVANHRLLDQLAICSWILDKLRAIQKQCQYSVDKLLDHAKKATTAKASDANIINDELSHKPDLDSLRPPDSNLTVSMDIDHETEINKDGIYRPLKLNPKLMDTRQNMLSKKQTRMVEQFKKKVKNHDIYQSVRESMTNLPTEERFYLEHLDNNKSKTRTKDLQNYEEDNYLRLKQSRSEFKKAQSKKRYKESSIGDNLNAFIDNLDKSYTDARTLGDFQAGGKFQDTIGKNTKKHLKGGKYIKGPWQKRQKVLFKTSKKGRKVESRKKWRRSHPFKTNPAKAARMKQHRFNKSSKVKKLLKKIK
eukprot:166681_1